MGSMRQCVMHDRAASERDFFDAYYHRVADTALDRFYDSSAGIRRFRSEIFSRCSGRRVLEVGCGPGGHGIALAERGGIVTGIDISNTAVELASRKAAEYPQLSIDYRLGNVEALDFDDGTFDIVCGTGIVHHVNVDRFSSEVRRVLKQGGSAVFYEPVAYSPIAFLYRIMTPAGHTPDEHPMVTDDMAVLRHHFSHVHDYFFSLLSPAAIPLLKKPLGEQLFRALELLEKPLLRVPALRWLGSFMVIVMKNGESAAGV
jgi:SAM-dependent methyltransferase